MSFLSSRWSSLGVGLLPLLVLVGCGSSDEDPPAAESPGGGSGTAGTTGSAGGAAGKGGAAGSKAGAGGTTAGAGGTSGAGGQAAGTGGTAGQGGSTAGTGGSTAGQGGSAGTGGTTAGSGGATGGAGGQVAGSGGTAGAGGSNAGAGGSGVVPTTCRASHGNEGCCSPDGTISYYFDGQSVGSVTCAAGMVCTWTKGYYDCDTGPAKTDPSGLVPAACGGPDLPADVTHCPAGCKGDADCAGSPSTPVCDVAGNECVECTSKAQCTGNTNTCNAANKCIFRCTSNADCKDATHPLCDLATAACRKEGPTTCDGTHGAPGCCSADHTTVFYTKKDGSITAKDCGPSESCTWTDITSSDGSFFYDCVAGEEIKADPSGVFSQACGAPFVAREVTGCPVSCQTDADCTTAPNGPVCDPMYSVCVECETNAHCQGNQKGPACNTTSRQCVECTASADCKDSPKGPTCNTTSSTCSCTASADCAGSALGPYCDSQSQVCVACTTDFHCTDPAKPACNSGVCGVNSQCPNDDGFEDADDGPLGATDLTPTAGDKSSITDHTICGTPLSEADYFKFTASDGDNVALTLSWTDHKQHLSLRVGDAQGRLLGLDGYRKEEFIKLDYLPAGTYYVRIQRNGGLVEATETIPYTLNFDRTTGNKCTSLADCAKDNATSVLRGHCNASTGVCESINGQGKLTKDQVCDSNGDCASGFCAASLFNQNASKFAFCTTGCQDSGECSEDQTCTLIDPESEMVVGYCAPKCTKDTECYTDISQPVSFGTEPWVYYTCEPTQGLCYQF